MSHEGGADGGQGENWQLVYESQDHGASVNGVAWAPWQYGPYLASASSDGKIGILHHSPADQQWVRTEFHAHTNGVNAVSWAPSGPATQGPSLGPMRMVSGGADNQVKLWQYDDRSQKWVELAGIDAENGHTDVIRDVAWRPNIVGAPSSTIASCSEDKTVIIWTQEMEGQPWKKAQVIQLDGPVRRVDWSVSGSLLAVACADKQVLLYKENLQGKWEEMITNLSHTQAPPPLQQQQHGQPEELLPAAPPEGWLPGDERRVPMWAYLMRGERDLRDGDTDDQAAAHRMQQVLAFGGVKLQQSEDTGAGRGDTNTNDDDTNDTKHKPAMLRGEEKSDTTKVHCCCLRVLSCVCAGCRHGDDVDQGVPPRVTNGQGQAQAACLPRPASRAAGGRPRGRPQPRETRRRGARRRDGRAEGGRGADRAGGHRRGGLG